MDELVVGGEKYISSKRAARLSGYAKDYIGQLCRDGKIEARMVGRSWYVKESALKEHRKHFQGEPVIDESLWKEGPRGLEFKGFGSVQATPNTPARITEEHIKIKYESDERPLIPTLREKEAEAAPVVEAEREAEEIPQTRASEEVPLKDEPLSFSAIDPVPVTTPQIPPHRRRLRRASSLRRRRIGGVWILAALLLMAALATVVGVEQTYILSEGAVQTIETRLAFWL